MQDLISIILRLEDEKENLFPLEHLEDIEFNCDPAVTEPRYEAKKKVDRSALSIVVNSGTIPGERVYEGVPELSQVFLSFPPAETEPGYVAKMNTDRSDQFSAVSNGVYLEDDSLSFPPAEAESGYVAKKKTDGFVRSSAMNMGGYLKTSEMEISLNYFPVADLLDAVKIPFNIEMIYEPR